MCNAGVLPRSEKALKDYLSDICNLGDCVEKDCQ